MLGKTTPKFCDQEDKLERSYTGENRREELSYVFDLRLDFDVGSMLRASSWIDRRMLASPGVDLRDLRREDDSTVTHDLHLDSSMPTECLFQIQNETHSSHQQRLLLFYFHLASMSRLAAETMLE